MLYYPGGVRTTAVNQAPKPNPNGFCQPILQTPPPSPDIMALTGSAAPESRKSFTAFSWLSVFPRPSCHEVHLLVAHNPPSSDVCFYTSCHCCCHTNTRGCGIKLYSLFRLIYTNMQPHKGSFKSEKKLSAFPDWGLRERRGEKYKRMA